jgi:hypothetical protein
MSFRDVYGVVFFVQLADAEAVTDARNSLEEVDS